jgi:hypothetical protein
MFPSLDGFLHKEYLLEKKFAILKTVEVQIPDIQNPEPFDFQTSFWKVPLAYMYCFC